MSKQYITASIKLPGQNSGDMA